MKKFFSNLFGKKEESPESSPKKAPPKPKYNLTNDPLNKSENTNSFSIKDPNKIISLNLRTNYSKLSRHDYDEVNSALPLLVTIDLKDVENDNLRLGLDLVIVVDVSSSMYGEKIKLVHETLKFILDELEEKDRVCLIKFGSIATQITGFKLMNKENKEHMKIVVEKDITVGGCTDIKGAMDKTYEALLSREHQNEATAVFLLSDGEDTCGNSNGDIKKALKEWHEKMNQRDFFYQIHSFGYGEEHDEHALSIISDVTSGNFYYIKTNNYLDECFIDCFGYLLSVIANQVEVVLKLNKGFEIVNLASMLWEKKSETEGVIKLHGLALGKTLNYITEMKINADKIKFKDLEKVVVGNIIMSYVYNSKEYTLGKELEITFVNKETDKGEIDQEVDENYMKLEAIEVMKKARDFINSNRGYLAQQELDAYYKNVHHRATKYKSSSVIPTIGYNMTMDNLMDNKDYMQLNRMMVENAYNPGYKNFSKMNKGQERMRFKKKGF
jgi:Mg-chelatase subunit ChlD